MRVELLICGDKEEPKPVPTVPTILPITERPARLVDLECIDLMGVDEGKMYQDQVQSSSLWQQPNLGKKLQLLELLKLSTPLAWRPLANSQNEFIEFDFLSHEIYLDL